MWGFPIKISFIRLRIFFKKIIHFKMTMWELPEGTFSSARLSRWSFNDDHYFFVFLMELFSFELHKKYGTSCNDHRDCRTEENLPLCVDIGIYRPLPTRYTCRLQSILEYLVILSEQTWPHRKIFWNSVCTVFWGFSIEFLLLTLWEFISNFYMC